MPCPSTTRWQTMGRFAAAATTVLVSLIGLPSAQAGTPTPLVRAHDAGTGASTFTTTESIGRDNLVNGTDTVLDSRTFSLSVDQTQNLRERQELTVTWSGAHPTGGIYSDPHAQLAAEQEYPVVILQCRGTDDPALPASQQLSQKTCWTATPAERYQSGNGLEFPSWRVDEYAGVADRALDVNVPTPYPSGCISGGGAETWVPFIAASETTYAGGPGGCDGIPPEESVLQQSLQPASTTFAATNLDGTGSAKFTVQTDESNASLGCNDKVACSLVVVPIEGISCDPNGQDLPAGDTADRPTADQVQNVDQACLGTDTYQAGQQAFGSPNQENLSTSGYLWWAASNWRNRISIPLTFAAPDNVCALAATSTASPLLLYGSELMAQATAQWGPAFCLDPRLFSFTHVLSSEPEAKNLLTNGGIEAAIQGAPPDTPVSSPTVEAPIAISGFAIAYDVSGPGGRAVGDLRLTPRLLAKLLTESYPGETAIKQGYSALAANPLDITHDPEFEALNPGVPQQIFYTAAASTLFTISSDADTITALTSYINADPAARAWLDGAADPWGMVVNPNYKGIALPVNNWPLLDSYADPTNAVYQAQNNPCLASNPVPFLPLEAAPVSTMAQVTLNMQFGIANSQIICNNPGALDQKLIGLGRENVNQQFLLGVVPLADAARYSLTTASLQSQVSPGAPTKFTDAEGRTFVGPTTAALAAATKLFTPTAHGDSWTLPYGDFQTDADAATAYPGTMLFSADIPTTGLPATDASEYAQLLEFAAGPGQTPGTANGDLAAGYLPMTAANSAGPQVAYTNAAAADVRAQNGQVPPLVASAAAPAAPASPAAPAAAAPSSSPAAVAGSADSGAQSGYASGSGGGSDLVGSSTTTGGATAGSSPAASAAAGAAPVPTSSTSITPAATRLKTPTLAAGLASLALPLAAVVAIAAALALGAGALVGRVRSPRG